jgi:uncharacterized protein YhfF
MIGKKTPEVEAYWQKARKALGLPEQDYHVSTFSDPRYSQRTDYISDLASKGVKQGTCHIELDFEVNKVRRRKPGDHWVVIDSKNNPLCVIKVTRVDIKPFNQIGEDFAKVENEGDGTFKYWYDGHLGYFERQCKAWDKEWRMDAPCVCEYFTKVYPA